MTERGLGLRLRQVRGGVPQRRRGSARPTRAASGSPTTRSCSASTPTTRTSRSRCPARSTASGGRSSSTPAARWPSTRRQRGGRPPVTGRRRQLVPRARCWCVQRRPTARAPGARWRPARSAPPRNPARRPVPADRQRPPRPVLDLPHPAPARLRPSTQVADLLPTSTRWASAALYASPLLESARVDPRLRRGRPHPDLDGARRRRTGCGAGGRAVREHGLGFVARHRAQPHRRRGAAGEPPGGGTCCGTARSRAYAALLRHRLGSPGRSCSRCWTRTRRRRSPSCPSRRTASELRYYEHAVPVAPGTEGGSAQEVHERQHYRFGSLEARRGAS